jgi:5-methylcytosine-specific restriction endonuclease McrA
VSGRRLESVPPLVADQYALTHNPFYRTHSAALVIQSSSLELLDAAALAVTVGEDILQPPDRVTLSSLLKPKAQKSGSAGYLRDPRVRAKVIQMAEGRCECCGELGFATENGERYLESHHVVEVSQRGPDSPTNVVAVCPLCHRKAHYAADRPLIERRMLEAIRRRGKRIDSA